MRYNYNYTTDIYIYITSPHEYIHKLYLCIHCTTYLPLGRPTSLYLHMVKSSQLFDTDRKTEQFFRFANSQGKQLILKSQYAFF